MKKKKLLALLLSTTMVVATVAPSTTVFATNEDFTDAAVFSADVESPDVTAPKWDYGATNYNVTVEVGTALSESEFIEMANATAYDDKEGNITIFPDSYHWSQVNTNKVGTYKVDLFAEDEAGNRSYNMMVTLNVVDTTAPVWNYGGNINYGISIPVGTPLMDKETFIAETNAANNVSDNSGEVPVITLNDWEWAQIDTSKVGKYPVNLYASDNSTNTSYNLGIVVYVVDGEAPVWNSNGDINYTVKVPVGTELTEEAFIKATNAAANVTDNYTAPEDIKIVADSYHWGQVDTNKVGTYKVDLYAFDESDNKTWGLGTWVKVVDEEAPEWNSNGDINYTVKIPVGTELTEEAFIKATNAAANVTDNYTAAEDIKIVADSYHWSQVNTNKIGTYKVDLYAFDESNNKTWGLGTWIEVVDEEAPEWNSNGNINYVVEVTVGTKLTEEAFIKATNAAANVIDNYTAPEDIKIVADSYHWSQVDTDKIGTYKVDLYAFDESNNKTWGLGTWVKVVEKTPVVKTVKIPVYIYQEQTAGKGDYRPERSNDIVIKTTDIPDNGKITVTADAIKGYTLNTRYTVDTVTYNSETGKIYGKIKFFYDKEKVAKRKIIVNFHSRYGSLKKSDLVKVKTITLTEGEGSNIYPYIYKTGRTSINKNFRWYFKDNNGKRHYVNSGTTLDFDSLCNSVVFNSKDVAYINAIDMPK